MVGSLDSSLVGKRCCTARDRRQGCAWYHLVIFLFSFSMAQSIKVSEILRNCDKGTCWEENDGDEKGERSVFCRLLCADVEFGLRDGVWGGTTLIRCFTSLKPHHASESAWCLCPTLTTLAQFIQFSYCLLPRLHDSDLHGPHPRAINISHLHLMPRKRNSRGWAHS